MPRQINRSPKQQRSSGTRAPAAREAYFEMIGTVIFAAGATFLGALIASWFGSDSAFSKFIAAVAVLMVALGFYLMFARLLEWPLPTKDNVRKTSLRVAFFGGLSIIFVAGALALYATIRNKPEELAATVQTISSAASDRNGNKLWYVYSIERGRTVGVLCIGYFLQVSNQTDSDLTVDRWEAAITLKSGVWNPYPIQTHNRSGRFYAGTSLMRVFKQPKDLDFEERTLNPVPRHGMVAGWLLFEIPRGLSFAEARGARITLWWNNGSKQLTVSPSASNVPSTGEAYGGTNLSFNGAPEDISAIRILNASPALRKSQGK